MLFQTSDRTQVYHSWLYAPFAKQNKLPSSQPKKNKILFLGQILYNAEAIIVFN